MNQYFVDRDLRHFKPIDLRNACAIIPPKMHLECPHKCLSPISKIPVFKWVPSILVDDRGNLLHQTKWYTCYICDQKAIVVMDEEKEKET